MTPKQARETRRIADIMRVEYRLSPVLESMVWRALIEHRLDNESAEETFGRLMQMAELSLMSKAK